MHAIQAARRQASSLEGWEEFVSSSLAPSLKGEGDAASELGFGSSGHALEFGFAFLGEGSRTLIVVGALTDALVIDTLHEARLGERHIQRVVDVLLGLLDHNLAVGVDRLRQLGGLSQQIVLGV